MLAFRFLEPYSSRLLSVLRIVSGAAFLEHGTMKLLHFPAPMMPGQLPPLLMTAGVIELVGGVLLVLGLFTRLTAFIAAGEMAVAYFMFHVPQKGIIWPAMNGGDAALLFCFVFLYLAAAGGGAWSLDNAMGKKAAA